MIHGQRTYQGEVITANPFKHPTEPASPQKGALPDHVLSPSRFTRDASPSKRTDGPSPVSGRPEPLRMRHPKQISRQPIHIYPSRPFASKGSRSTPSLDKCLGSNSN
ncbi:hypothetical protein LZ32DRAFT_9040 [Colletotrichum eremochloae]|nr:hypothetical protein LZ32DRAFT_9040 [Colletotrichum eremochloae]